MKKQILTILAFPFKVILGIVGLTADMTAAIILSMTTLLGTAISTINATFHAVAIAAAEMLGTVSASITRAVRIATTSAQSQPQLRDPQTVTLDEVLAEMSKTTSNVHPNAKRTNGSTQMWEEKENKKDVGA